MNVTKQIMEAHEVRLKGIEASFVNLVREGEQRGVVEAHCAQFAKDRLKEAGMWLRRGWEEKSK